MNSASLAAFVLYLQHQRHIVDFTYISAVSAFIYDYISTLHLEIKFIWLMQWNYTTVIFLMLRYTSLIHLCLALHNQLSPNVPVEGCKVVYPIAVWLLAFQICLADTILSIRTWAVWNRNKSVGIGLATLSLATLVAHCVFLNMVVQSMQYAPAPYPGFRGCFITSTKRTFWMNFVLTTVTEAIDLALMAISAFQSFRVGCQGRLSLMIHRDGILFYVYLLCISCANVAVSVAAPPDLMILLAPLQYMLHSVLTARIVFNIRSEVSRGVQSELHTSYEELPQTVMPLQTLKRHDHTQRLVLRISLHRSLRYYVAGTRFAKGAKPNEITKVENK